MRCCYGKATHAVVGVGLPHADGAKAGVGVLCWHDNELAAYREAKQINNKGGDCRVVEAPEGELPDDAQEEITILLTSYFGG